MFVHGGSAVLLRPVFPIAYFLADLGVLKTPPFFIGPLDIGLQACLCNSSSCESPATKKTACARRWRARSRSRPGTAGRADPGARGAGPLRSRTAKRRDTDRKLYPGYVFIELELDKNGMIPEKVWFMIKETDGVGDFIGSNGKPTPMSPKDQAKMLEEAERPDDSGPTIQTAYKKRRPDQGDRRPVREFRGRCGRDHRRQGNGPDHRHDLRPADAAGIGILAD